MTENLTRIAPVSDTKRPLWSVVIPTYNCAEYLKDTLLSVLQQDPGEEQMEIIVVDDHSTKDDPESVVQQYGNGRVKFIRQAQNVGKSNNYLTGIQSTKGELIHLLHGDDRVLDGFYQKMKSLFLECKDTSIAFCRCEYINASGNKIGETGLISPKDGILPNFIEKIAVWQLLQPPSIVFKRIVYETIGTYDFRLKYMEDWEFYVRSALHFEVSYTPDTLAQYRIFEENSSSKSAKKGKRAKAKQKVIKTIDAYLPSDIKKKIKKKRRQATALYMLGYIPKCMKSKDYFGAIIYSIHFFKFNRNPRLVGRWARFVFNYNKYC